MQPLLKSLNLSFILERGFSLHLLRVCNERRNLNLEVAYFEATNVPKSIVALNQQRPGGKTLDSMRYILTILKD